MKGRIVFGALLVSVALAGQGFGFELLNDLLGLNRGCSNACCEPQCCEQPACCEKACQPACQPECCEPCCKPKCCKPLLCCKPRCCKPSPAQPIEGLTMLCVCDIPPSEKTATPKASPLSIFPLS